MPLPRLCAEQHDVNFRCGRDRAGHPVHKTPNGTAPRDLPAEFPLQMVVNFSKALGITVPSLLLPLAEELIE